MQHLVSLSTKELMITVGALRNLRENTEDQNDLKAIDILIQCLDRTVKDDTR